MNYRKNDRWPSYRLNLGNAAKLLKIAPKTLRLAAEADRSKPSAIGRPVDLRPRLADDNCCSIYRPTSTAEPKIPRGIAHPNQQSPFSSTT